MTRSIGRPASGLHRAGVAFGLALATLVPGGISLVSVEDEIAIGRAAEAEVRRRLPELADPPVRAYLDEVGRRLAARAGGPPYPYRFSVADSREVNAFALPGGPVWVYRGALELAATEAELAGVLAHEVAHIARRHAAERLTGVMLAHGLLTLLGALLGNDGGARAAQIGARLVADGLFLKFSRDDEREADRVGAALVARAGWDPRGMITFLRRVRARQGRDPTAFEAFVSTHPPAAERIRLLEGEVPRLGRGQRDSVAFQRAKARLQRLAPARSLPRR
jgi:predicted Zn-dependent protease